VIMTSFGVTTILTYVNVSPLLIMTELGFDRGQYSYTMALTALVSMLVSFSAPFALNVFKQKSLMLTSQTCFIVAASFANSLDGWWTRTLRDINRLRFRVWRILVRLWCRDEPSIEQLFAAGRCG